MTLTQILQKIRNAFYTKKEIDAMGGGASLSDTISQKANASDLTAHANNTDIHVTSKDKTTWNAKQSALSTAQLNACNSGITSDKVSQYDEYIGGASGQPVGSVLWVMGSTVPAGYLICNGSAVSRTAYAKLFQAIGTKYGEGDGSSTFNLPNLINRFLQGSETSGTIGGEATHTLTIDEIPSHNHSATSSSNGDHNHSLVSITGYDDKNFINGTDQFLIQNSDTTIGWPAAVNASLKYGSTGNAGSHSHSLTVNSTGGSQPHNNLPPYITSIPCIKAFDSVIDATTVSVAQLSDTKVNKAGDTMTGSLTAPSFVANGIDCSVDSQGDGYIRYSNGIQICWGQTSCSIDTTESQIGIDTRAYYGFKYVNFSSAFKAGTSPYCTVTVIDTEYGIYGSCTYNMTNALVAIEIYGPNHSVSLDVQYIAIGKWK